MVAASIRLLRPNTVGIWSTVSKSSTTIARGYATATPTSVGTSSTPPLPHTIGSRRLPKDEGTISSIFTSLTGEANETQLPERFSDLKKEIWVDGMHQSWKEVLVELESKVEEVAARGSEVGIAAL